MAKMLPKTYNFNKTEERIYKMWENADTLNRLNDPKEADHDPRNQTLCHINSPTQCNR